MTKRNREIKACEDLLAHYQGEIDLAGCPLCSLGPCWKKRTECLWIRFEKMSCNAYVGKLKLYYAPCRYRINIRLSKRWTQSRIKMLRRWIRLLKKER